MNDDNQYDTGCSCDDGACTDCARDMRADLDMVLAVLDLAAAGLNPDDTLILVPGSAAARVAAALTVKGGPNA